MTKGITNWIKAHAPIGRSKSEPSRTSESRAKIKLEQTRQTKVTFHPDARDIGLQSARFAQMQPSRKRAIRRNNTGGGSNREGKRNSAETDRGSFAGGRGKDVAELIGATDDETG